MGHCSTISCVWASLSVLLISLSCAKAPERRELPGDPPVGKVILFHNRITVSAAPQANWKELVKLDIFDGFRPGITIEEAKREVGMPSDLARNHYGPYSVYRQPGGLLHVAWEEHRSGEDAYKVWTLRAYPDAVSSTDMLHPSVSKHIEPEAERLQVIILGSDDEPAVDISIKRGRVESLTWLKP